MIGNGTSKVRRPGRVTTSDVRELDRAMMLLHKGRISYGRWVETVAAWCRGEDVSELDFGDAESIPERIVQHFEGMTVSSGEVAKAFEIPLTTASASLRRISERGFAHRVSLGRWHINRRTPHPTPGEKP